MTPHELHPSVYRDLLAASPSPIVVHDAGGRVIQANQAFADLLGYPLHEVLTLDAGTVVHPVDRAVRDADAARLIGGEADGLTAQRRLVRRGGDALRVRVRKAATTVDDQRVVMVVIEDWTEESGLIDELRHAVVTDDLTGVLNRRGVWAHLDALTPEDYPLVLAVVDVDRLKVVNDTAGHAAGDLVLRTVASRLEGLVGPGAVAARQSGDEFLVIAPAAAWTRESLEDAIRTRVGSAAVPDPGTGRRLRTGVSVGTSILDGPEGYSAALALADERMYADKSSDHGAAHGAAHGATHVTPHDAAGRAGRAAGRGRVGA